MARDEVACAKRTLINLIATLVQFDLPSLIRYSHEAGWSSLVARRAHNPKVVSSNLTPATNFIDSRGLVGLHQQALLLFGKDFGKKSMRGGLALCPARQKNRA
jgi:hypothetical protein